MLFRGSALGQPFRDLAADIVHVPRLERTFDAFRNGCFQRRALLGSCPGAAVEIDQSDSENFLIVLELAGGAQVLHDGRQFRRHVDLHPAKIAWTPAQPTRS